MGISRLPQQLKTNLSKTSYSPFALCCALAFCLGFAPQMKADFTGYYSLSNFTITDTDGAPGFPNGSAVTPDGGMSIILTGGDDGHDTDGIIDLTINAQVTGLVQFNWAYSSTDASSYIDPNNPPSYPPGCGAGFLYSCDQAGYLVGNTFTFLADDQHQGTGLVTFNVNAGQSFGFQVETFDNTGGPGVLTLSNFSEMDPTPEPNTLILLLALMTGLLAMRHWKARNAKGEEAEG